MGESLKPTFEWIVSSTGTTVSCSVIALFGLAVYFLYFLPRSMKVSRLLREATAKVTAHSGEEAFAANFESLDEAFAEHPMLGHGWGEFKDSLIWPPQLDGANVIGNSHEAAAYFDAPGLAQGQFNLRFVQAVPGYLTGGGILGTFIGLVAGISLASTGLGSDNLNDIKNALTPLLKGASVAFLTSVVGLFLSMLFSAAEKYHLHRIEQDVEQWNAALDKRLRRVTPEQLARKQIEEALKQTLQLETFNTDMAMSIAAELEGRMQKSFGPQLGLVATGLQELKGQQPQFSEDLLNKVSASLRDALSGAAGTEMERMGETLSGLVSILQQSAGMLSSGQSEMAQAVSGIIERIEQAFGQSASSLSSETTKVIERLVLQMDAAGHSTSAELQKAGATMAGTMTAAGQAAADSLATAGSEAAKSISEAAIEAARHFGESAALVTSGANKFGDVARRVTELHGEHGKSLQQVQSVLKELQTVHGAFKLTVDPLNSAVVGLRTVNEALGARVQESAALQKSLITAAADVRKAQEQMSQAFAEYEARFKGVDDSLGRTFVQLTEGVDTYTATVRDFVSGTEKQFSKALGELSNVLNELDGTVEEFTKGARLQRAKR